MHADGLNSATNHQWSDCSIRVFYDPVTVLLECNMQHAHFPKVFTCKL